MIQQDVSKGTAFGWLKAETFPYRGFAPHPTKGSPLETIFSKTRCRKPGFLPGYGAALHISFTAKGFSS
ncbi:hypothetical protein EDC15_10976 [Acetobacter aceti NBRC 14818]|uniref:hypothetical protein n=1 Tax=Acetobacter aceti TaxID=435 RepID=UPI00037669A0|nr:hypothetical protein [Acetobacter aceti]TCS33006.1 hypothetical protein EDC15_10976 [Acetobacter aceti NBRC 14818]